MYPITTYALYNFTIPASFHQVAFVPSLFQVVVMEDPNGKFSAYDLEKGNKVYHLEGLGSAGSLITFFGQAISGMDGGQILAWDLENQIFLGEIGNHGSWQRVTALDASVSGPSLISGDENGVVRYWNRGSGEKKILGEHDEIVDCVAISSDGETAVSGSIDGTIRLWNCQYAKQSDTVDLGYRTLGLDFSQDGKYVINASGYITKRERTTLDEVWTYSERDEVYFSCSFSMEDYFILCSGPGILSLLDADTGDKLVTFEGQTGTILGMGFSLNGQQVYSAGDDGVVRVWRLPL